MDAYLENDPREEFIAFPVAPVEVDMIDSSKRIHQRPQSVGILQREGRMMQQGGYAFHLVWQV